MEQARRNEAGLGEAYFLLETRVTRLRVVRRRAGFFAFRGLRAARVGASFFSRIFWMP